MPTAGIILCGGESSRMGFPKALLPFGPELMLERMVRLLSQVVDPLVVVAAVGQKLPALPPGVQVVRDEREAQGPLEGLRAGLTALAGRAERAYATSCDVPLLVPAFVRRLIDLAEEGHWQIVVPEAEGFKHPLSAVYSIDVLPEIESLLTANRLRPSLLLERVPTRIVAASLLEEVDPGLNTLRNLNHPADYLAALQLAGLPAPRNVSRSLGK
jgi:molybdopterin-guanine dinucleotide biosynthesis protein A